MEFDQGVWRMMVERGMRKKTWLRYKAGIYVCELSGYIGSYSHDFGFSEVP